MPASRLTETINHVAAPDTGEVELPDGSLRWNRDVIAVKTAGAGFTLRAADRPTVQLSRARVKGGGIFGGRRREMLHMLLRAGSVRFEAMAPVAKTGLSQGLALHEGGGQELELEEVLNLTRFAVQRLNAPLNIAGEEAGVSPGEMAKYKDRPKSLAYWTGRGVGSLVVTNKGRAIGLGTIVLMILLFLLL